MSVVVTSRGYLFAIIGSVCESRHASIRITALPFVLIKDFSRTGMEVGTFETGPKKFYQVEFKALRGRCAAAGFAGGDSTMQAPRDERNEAESGCVFTSGRRVPALAVPVADRRIH